VSKKKKRGGGGKGNFFKKDEERDAKAKGGAKGGNNTNECLRNLINAVNEKVDQRKSMYKIKFNKKNQTHKGEGVIK